MFHQACPGVKGLTRLYVTHRGQAQTTNGNHIEHGAAKRSGSLSHSGIRAATTTWRSTTQLHQDAEHCGSGGSGMCVPPLLHTPLQLWCGICGILQPAGLDWLRNVHPPCQVAPSWPPVLHNLPPLLAKPSSAMGNNGCSSDVKQTPPDMATLGCTLVVPHHESTWCA